MALYAYDVPGLADPIALKPGFWRQHLLQGGVAVARDGRQFTVRRADGTTTTARFQRVLLGFDIPEVVIDGTTYAYAARLPFWLATWCFLPVALIVLGGFIPALIGLLAAIGNLRVMRTTASPGAKAVASLGLSAAAVAAVLLIGSLLTHVVRR